MPEYLAPGVFVEEIEIGPKSIEGVGTSTAAFIGECERGPVKPTLVTGVEQYRRLFGTYAWKTNGQPSTSFMRQALEGFFSNGGKRCFVTRVVGDAQLAKLNIAVTRGGDETSPEAGEAAAARKRAAELKEDAVNKAGEAKAAAEQAAAETDPEAKARAEKDATAKAKAAERAKEKAEEAIALAHQAAANVQGGPVFTVGALGPGAWGNRILISFSKASVEAMPMAADKKGKLFRAVVEYWKDRDQQPWLQEVYDNVSIDPRSPDYVVKRVSGYSSLIDISASEDPNLTVDETVSANDIEPSGKTKQIWLTNGSDAKKLSLPDYLGSEEPGARTGLSALETVDEAAIVCAPNAQDVEGLDLALVTHCEKLKDRFAILQTSGGPKSAADLAAPTDSQFAAYYYPWIKVIDGGSGVARLIPPVGHLAGIYARTDIERGVHKAPANEVVRGARGVEVEVTRGEQEILNPRGVNCIRKFPGRGIRVWGARTMSSDPLWTYINVRRLFNYLEESIEEGTQWVVFEPNNQRLWSRVRQTVSGFLTTAWRDGALMGTTADEAFFVKCDETTMTPNDIETGRLIVLVGVAPVRPAEFVIFRVAQWRGGSAIEE